MKKKILTYFLLFCLILSLFPSSALAVEETNTQTETETSEGSDTGSQTGTGTSANAGSDTGSQTGTGTSADTGSDTDHDTETVLPTTDSTLASLLTTITSEAAVLSVSNNTYTDTGSHSVNLDNTTYSLTLDVDPTNFTGTPKLVVSIPKGITLSSYPTSSNTTLSSYIQSVGTETETDGSTTLTYTFNTGISTVGFNISLLPTYKLMTGSSYAVTASIYDGDNSTPEGTASDSITIASNPTLANCAYNCSREALQYINLSTVDYYYAKADLYFATYYANHYDYDSLTITVPIPKEATPGYYDSNGSFVVLTDGTPYSFPDGTATYETNQTFTNDSNNTVGTGNAVVFNLSASHGLTTSACQSFNMYNSNMGGIYLRFPSNTEAGTYTPGVSSKVVAQVGNSNYTLLEYDSYPGLSYQTVSYTFQDYDVNNFIYTGMGNGYKSVNTGNYLMPQADNQYFYSYLYNLSGDDLADVEVEYSGGFSDSDVTPLSADIHCYKLVFNLSSGVNPSTVDVTYSYYDASTGKTNTDGHAYLAASDATLSLDEGDYFTDIRATYDHVGLSAYSYSSITTLSAYCYNAKNLNEGTCNIYSKILSAKTNTTTYGASVWTKTANTCFYPRTELSVCPNSINLQGTSNGMDKGSKYSFSFYPATYGTLNDLCVYFLLPYGYEFQSYTPPYDWGVTSSDYTISSRTITVGSDTNLGTGGYSCKVTAGTYTLYTIQYTDGANHISLSLHNVCFSLGPTVDTAEVKTGVTVPAAIGMTTASAVYPFDCGSYYQLQDLLDFDDDNDTAETFARFYSLTSATQNAAKVISMSGALTSSHESGSGSIKSYQYNSTGGYTFTVYNGLDSGNTAQDATINIAVPSKGTGIAARLTGAPTLDGNFLADAAVTYSSDSGSTYVPESSVSDWNTVTNIKIITASGVGLSSGASAYVTVPFTASYDTLVSSSSTAVFTGAMSYSLYKNSALSSTPSAAAQDCTMEAASLPVSGTVYKDYDDDGVRDANEQNNGKFYIAGLYSGAYTSGTTGLTSISSCLADSTTGAFSFPSSIYQPGTYTLSMSLASTEKLGTHSTGWTLDSNGCAYYTFTVGGSVTSVKESLPLNAPRTLLLNYSSCYLYNTATKKLIPTVLPALESKEAVTYESSDPDVVTVASDGTLTYVADGTAIITATVPGYAGGDTVSATCTVYARKGSYSITLHAGDNTTLSETGYTLSSGCYTGSYTSSGSCIYLPTASFMTNSDATYYFEGWYDNADFTGSSVPYITSTDYGSKEYYAKWSQYEAAYETDANTWVYGTFSTALSGVYNGGTIKLLKDVSFYGLPTITKDITLATDGNARTLTINYFLYVTTGSLTIDSADLTITGSTYYSYLILNSGGTVNIKVGTISSTSLYGIQNSGTLNISGGTVNCTNSFSGAAAIYNHDSGAVSITGGSITNSHTDGSAICEGVDATGLITISDAPVITSASEYTIECLSHATDTAAIDYFGKTYYSSSLSNITLTGTYDGSGNYVINSENCDEAIVSAKNIQSGYALIAWTSDSGHSSQLSTVNGAAVSSLQSADSSPFTTVYAYLGQAQYTVSGTVSKGSASLSDLSGITVTLYSSGSATTYTAQTDASGSFTIPNVPAGDYTAVVEKDESGKYARSKSIMFTLTDTAYSGLSITLSAPVTNGYPIFVISKGTSADSEYYYIYEKKSDGSVFEPFKDSNAVDDSYGYSSIKDVMTDVSAESVDYSPTLYFGATGTDTDCISGSLNLGSEYVYLGDGNTYTVKGSITSAMDSDPTIFLGDGTSLIIDGAHIDSTGSEAVENDGAGSIKLINGTVTSENYPAIESYGEDSSIDISGGTVSGEAYAVSGENIHISGGNIECAGGPALVCFGGENTISGGTLTVYNSSISFDPESNSIPGTVLLYSQSDHNQLTVSGGTIKNTAATGYAIYLYNWQHNSYSYSSELTLSGHPSISGAGDIWANTAIYANDGAVSNPASYTGGALTLYYGGSDLQVGTVAVRNVTEGTNDEKFSLTNTGYGLLRNNTDLVIATAPAAPTGLVGTAPTSENGTDGSISGTTTAMEYKPVSGGVFTACADHSTTVGKTGNYLVRHAATDTSAASPTVTVYVPPYISHSVSGTVDNDSNQPVSGAAVRVMQGNTQFGITVMTDADGKFTVLGIPGGEFNLVVTKSSNTVTKFIVVSGADYVAGTIVLPDNDRYSILAITGDDTPDVVVNGLDQEAKAQTEDSCTVTMTVEQKAANDAAIQDQASAIAVIADGQTIEYLKIDVTKTVGIDAPTPLNSLTNVQEIAVPYDFSGKTDVIVYRYHGDSAAALTSLSARPTLSGAKDGTFYADSVNGKIYIYANKFSTYAIGCSSDSGSGSGGSFPSTASYTIAASAGTGGSISPSGSTSIVYGGSKTYRITSDDGYSIIDVLVDGVSVGAVGSYSFKNVQKAHTIKAVFAKTSGLPYYIGSDGSKIFIGFASDKNGAMKYIAPGSVTVLFAPNLKDFTDITGHWAESYIDFVTERELFVGTADHVFSPDTGMTRAMFAAVIGRLYERSYGTLTNRSEHAFTDVNYNDYYGRYVDWASQNKIISGVGGGLFEPDREITRQEMAAILYRFAEFLGVSMKDCQNTLLTYPDASSISSWAMDAAKYCQQTGIIAGRDNGNFVPRGTATRAEVAAILKRFIETVV